MLRVPWGMANLKTTFNMVGFERYLKDDHISFNLFMPRVAGKA